MSINTFSPLGREDAFTLTVSLASDEEQATRLGRALVSAGWADGVDERVAAKGRKWGSTSTLVARRDITSAQLSDLARENALGAPLIAVVARTELPIADAALDIATLGPLRRAGSAFAAGAREGLGNALENAGNVLQGASGIFLVWQILMVVAAVALLYWLFKSGKLPTGG